MVKNNSSAIPCWPVSNTTQYTELECKNMFIFYAIICHKVHMELYFLWEYVYHKLYLPTFWRLIYWEHGYFNIKLLKLHWSKKGFSSMSKFEDIIQCIINKSFHMYNLTNETLLYFKIFNVITNPALYSLSKIVH